MQKIICKKVYDTETSTFIHKVTVGEYGDPKGYEECLFQTESGAFFLYVKGGEESKYPTENIVRISAEKKDVWLRENA